LYILYAINLLLRGRSWQCTGMHIICMVKGK
jgi:hypothetical protein